MLSKERLEKFSAIPGVMLPRDPRGEIWKVNTVGKSSSERSFFLPLVVLAANSEGKAPQSTIIKGQGWTFYIGRVLVVGPFFRRDGAPSVMVHSQLFSTTLVKAKWELVGDA